MRVKEKEVVGRAAETKPIWAKMEGARAESIDTGPELALLPVLL